MLLKLMHVFFTEFHNWNLLKEIFLKMQQNPLLNGCQTNKEVDCWQVGVRRLRYTYLTFRAPDTLWFFFTRINSTRTMSRKSKKFTCKKYEFIFIMYVIFQFNKIWPQFNTYICFCFKLYKTDLFIVKSNRKWKV